MCPPGLGFASVSERAMALAGREAGRAASTSTGRRPRGARRGTRRTRPFTPAVTPVPRLDVALGMIFEEGLERVFARHAILARAARAGIEAIGLERFGADDPDANVVTAATLPDEIDGAAVPKLMRDRYGVTVAGGQGHLKGRIVRIAHCGYYGGFDIVVALTALEMTLRDLGTRSSPARAPGRLSASSRRRARSSRRPPAHVSSSDPDDPSPGPRQGEDRRRRRRPAAGRVRRRGRARLGRTRSSPSGSAISTRS